MVESIFALLSASPIVSIVLGFLLAGFLAFIFKDLIRDYIKKKYNLYDGGEIKIALEKTTQDNEFYLKSSEKLTPSIETRFLKNLNNDA